jgi:WD40 repeat protein
LSDLLKDKFAFFDSLGRLWEIDYTGKHISYSKWTPEIEASQPFISLTQLFPEKREISLVSPGFDEFNLSPPDGRSILRPVPISVTFSPDSRHITILSSLKWKWSSGASGDTKHSLELWDLATQKRLAVLNKDDLHQYPRSLFYSSDGKQITGYITSL